MRLETIYISATSLRSYSDVLQLRRELFEFLEKAMFPTQGSRVAVEVSESDGYELQVKIPRHLQSLRGTTNFLESIESFLKEHVHRGSKVHVGWHPERKVHGSSERVSDSTEDNQDSPLFSSELNIVFSEALSPEQIKGTLEALADYYRACGGLGFETGFEFQDITAKVLAHA